MTRGRTGRSIAWALAGSLALATVLAWSLTVWAFQAELARAGREISNRQFVAARQRLARLASWGSRGPEVRYAQGLCEQALGNPKGALEAWSAVPRNSPRSPDAALLRARVLVRTFGRLAEAEALLNEAARGSQATASSARWALAELLLWEGRVAEVRRLLVASWPRSAGRDRIALLREHWRLDSVVVNAGEVGPVLDAARAHAPNDDRAWLASAALALHRGDLREADRLLNDCLAVRPDDAVLWRARREWGLSAGRPEVVALALRRSPAEPLSPRDVLTLRAWFAARRGDRHAERQALESLSELEPGDPAPLERRAALAHEAGEVSREADLRRLKADVDRTRDLYRWALLSLSAEPDGARCQELARIAEALGRTFEARGWWTLAIARAPFEPAPRAALESLTSRENARRTLPGSTPSALLAELSQLSRPTPGFEPASAPRVPLFRDDAARAGLNSGYYSPPSPLRQIPEVMGGGAALLDYDGDGRLDLFHVQGAAGFPPAPGATLPGGGNRLYRNRGDGTFEDVSEQAGIRGEPTDFGFGVTAGDYDNDGHPDLFLTCWRAYRLFHNRGDGTFADVTADVGLGGNRDWPTSAAFADLDNDGDLDLYVCHYLDWDEKAPVVCRATPEGPPVSCLPLRFPAMPDHLFRNDGARFVDVSASAGITAADAQGRGLGVVAADLDGDGRVDLYVANDQSPNYLFRNQSGMKFKEEAFEAGVACGGDGTFRAGMGVACGDLDGDGAPDLAVTNFFGESTTLYHNLGGGMFSDTTQAVGLAAASRFLLGFGVAFLDANNDARLDLATANGHVSDLRPGTPFDMPAQLLLGTAGGLLTDASSQAGEPWTRGQIGRGLATGDLDDDGNLDIVFVPQNAPLVYAHNLTRGGGHFVRFRLQGVASNRDGVGTHIRLESGGRRQDHWRVGGGSYLSSSDPRPHFGLGAASQVDQLEVVWPSGQVDRFQSLPANTTYLLREGAERPIPNPR